MRCSLAKIRRGWFASLLVLAALMLSGCLFPSEAPTRYFLLDYAPGEQNAGGGETPGARAADEPLFDATVLIEDATVAPLYDRRQIVQRPAAPEIFLLTRELWAVSPSDAVREAIHDAVRDRGLFREVVRSSRVAREPYIIRTRVDSLEYRCCEATPLAIFDIEILLLDSEGSILARSRTTSEDRVSASVTDFVLSVNERLTEAIDAFVSEVVAISP